MAVSLQALTLNTPTKEQLHALESRLLFQRKLIEEWFKKQWELTAPPVYGSVDLRNAGFKLAPVDMNLFPAGFNNLNPDFLPQAIHAAKQSILNISPNVKNILILPERHTRNIRYWANVKTLQNILEKAGFNIRLAILDSITTPRDLLLETGEKIRINPLLRKANQLYVDNFVPDLILLNNDLSEGVPEILNNLDQKITPPVQLGWNQRFKSEHFQYYAAIAKEFAETINIDPWLISPLFRHCGQIDFMHREGMDCLVKNAEKLFVEIEKKYQQYQIPYQPFLIVKADAGTYGMAVMTVRNVDELKSMNRKQRTRMSVTKGGLPVHRVIIQEGVYTFETFGPEEYVAEPVIYLWGPHVVGGFYRVHQNRGIDENLNSPGMRFEPLAFTETCNDPREELEPDAAPNRFYTYGVVARLSMLAAAREIEEQRKK